MKLAVGKQLNYFVHNRVVNDGSELELSDIIKLWKRNLLLTYYRRR